MTKILDLGCGKRKQKGAIGIDISKETDADIIHDLNTFPYPFVDNEFDYIICDNIIEHLDNVIKTMEEIWRISKNNATIKIDVPYFRSLYGSIDPTHKHFFTYHSFFYFDPDHTFNELYKYSEAKFKVEKIVFDEKFNYRFIYKLIRWFANKFPFLYEYRISHLIPLNSLTFYLKTIK
ncbi:MAG: class I SAM-dependent methyltransferase [Halobacteriota archaeon]